MTTPTARRDLARTRATGTDLRAALESASAWLTANAERVNALNVFPVPDGDTGTNMSLTLKAAVDGLARLGAEPTVGQVTRAVYEGAMLAARGNSGVILSQLLSGFAQALADSSDLSPEGLARALGQAAEVGYRGVSKPVEGTILTAARIAGEAAREAAAGSADLPAVLEKTLAETTAAVANTPNQLDILKKAGVVDSGAEGYRLIIEGAWMWSTGRSQELASAPEAQPTATAVLHDLASDGSTFGFCTEILMRDADVTLPDVKARMEALGDSVIAVGDAGLLRVHVHTEHPGQVLEYGVDHGTLVKVKIDNMQLQHEAFAARSAAAGHDQPVATDAPTGTLGVIAVTAGEGLQKVFRSLGARVVQGGQTMNPSVQEILAAVNNSGYKELIVLPNNSNVILTARQVQELTSHPVAVVATESIPQGIGALLAFNYEADLQTNVEAMQVAAHGVHTVEVTRAVRDAKLDHISVHAGDMLAIYDGHIVASSATADQALLEACARAPIDALEIVTIYYGEGATEADAQVAAERLRVAHPGLAAEVVAGGQPHYPFVVSLE